MRAWLALPRLERGAYSTALESVISRRATLREWLMLLALRGWEGEGLHRGRTQGSPADAAATAW
jgi:hypothetical protein